MALKSDAIHGGISSCLRGAEPAKALKISTARGSDDRPAHPIVRHFGLLTPRL